MKLTNEQSAMQELLYRSLDTPLSAAEKEALSDALEEQPWLRQEKECILQIRASLGDLRGQAKAGFAEQVINRLPEAINRLSLQRLWPVAVAASVLMLVAAVSIIYSTAGSLETEAVMGIEELEWEDVFALGDY